MRWCCCAFLILLLAAGGAQAAEMQVLKMPNGDGVLITVEGEFKLSDGPRFAALADGHDRAVVVFNSPGGNLFAGLQMGALIHLKRFRTFVLQDGVCESACAIAWLGGVPRMMQPGSHVGFHSAFDPDTRQVVGVGNAWVGAYMSQLGLGLPAIAYLEHSLPDGITWLTPETAHQYNIDLVVLPIAPEQASPPEPAPVPAPEPRSTTQAATRRLLPFLAIPMPKPEPISTPASLAARARLFALDYFTHWSEANAPALDYFNGAYADTVVFYGGAMPRATLMAAKQRFAASWPVRIYSVRPSSARVFCDDATRRCAVSGVVDWDCRDPARGARSAGRANFMLVLSFADVPTGTIIGEAGSVISRTN